MDDLVKRLGAVEAAVSDIRAQVSALSASGVHTATKADVAKLETSIIKWVVGTMIASAGLAFAIAKYVS